MVRIKKISMSSRSRVREPYLFTEEYLLSEKVEGQTGSGVRQLGQPSW